MLFPLTTINVVDTALCRRASQTLQRPRQSGAATAATDPMMAFQREIRESDDDATVDAALRFAEVFGAVHL